MAASRRDGTIKGTRGPAEVRITENEVVFSDAQLTMGRPWSAVRELREEEDGVYIKCTDKSVLRVPRRACAGEGEWGEFVGELRGRVGG